MCSSLHKLGGTGWNGAVTAYNTRRAKIKGKIVAHVSVYFGFDLPVTFPYYQGANPCQPIQIPLGLPNPWRNGSYNIES